MTAEAEVRDSVVLVATLPQPAIRYLASLAKWQDARGGWQDHQGMGDMLVFPGGVDKLIEL